MHIRLMDVVCRCGWMNKSLQSVHSVTVMDDRNVSLEQHKIVHVHEYKKY